jgi:hypothetical protein
MNLELVDQIAKAVLYEGYMLYPYRPSSVKNQQRFNFGVVYPQAYSDAQGGVEPSRMQTECLVRGAAATIDLRLRFLHLQTRSASTASSTSACEGWQEAVERDVAVWKLSLNDLCQHASLSTFSFPAQAQVVAKCDEPASGSIGAGVLRQESVQGVIEISAQTIVDDVFKIEIQVRNDTPMDEASASRGLALMHSLVSTHFVLGAEHGEFISLLEPPEELQAIASQCNNIGAWPVLVGDPGQRDTLLASPIILYDHPQIAPESAGDLFDGTEIDEILSLRIMTLTDDEKREIRASDARARQILERTENMPAEQFMKLHGAVRSLRPLHLPAEEDA